MADHGHEEAFAGPPVAIGIPRKAAFRQGGGNVPSRPFADGIRYCDPIMVFTRRRSFGDGEDWQSLTRAPGTTKKSPPSRIVPIACLYP